MKNEKWNPPIKTTPEAERRVYDGPPNYPHQNYPHQKQWFTLLRDNRS